MATGPTMIPSPVSSSPKNVVHLCTESSWICHLGWNSADRGNSLAPYERRVIELLRNSRDKVHISSPSQGRCMNWRFALKAISVF